MTEVKVIFSDNDCTCTVIMPNGERKDFVQVSAMLKWCAENGLEPMFS